jgi:hypothetical protein
MNGTGAGDRQFIREATRPKLPSGLLSHPELPGNPFGTPPQLLQPEYRQELAAEKGMIISLRTVERNDRSPLSGIAAPRSKRASGLRPSLHCQDGLAASPPVEDRIGILFDGT